jgi:hypothetical protein
MRPKSRRLSPEPSDASVDVEPADGFGDYDPDS